MLDAETKRRIDTCRDILVGKVPDPKSQVEQITIALIYKFMDDMDAEAEELGGARSFFTGDHARYGWARLMAPNMGGFDMLALYSEAIGKMNENPGIPPLFRDIFKNAYAGFDAWFREKAQEGRRAWIYRGDDGQLAALCIYTVQTGEEINDVHERLAGNALKLCTFKVGEQVRGRKIGELFLKAAFRYATEHACEHVFTHTDASEHDYLVRLLEDFGFGQRGNYGNDVVLVKEHPRVAPEAGDVASLEYARRYFPHYRRDNSVQKFIVPIRPQYHDILLPDYQPHQGRLFGVQNNAGNAIKLAYLCHAPTNSILPGDVLLFYRTVDEKAVTSVGVVDNFKTLQDAAEIASLVSRRTVYSQREIEEMAATATKVILFRLVEHFPRQVSYTQLQQACGVAGPIQSIRKIQDDQFSKILNAAGR